MARKTFSRDLGVQYWSQAKSTWGSERTSCGGTMKSEGCVITSVAMIFDHFGDSIDPLILLNKLKPTGDDCAFDWWVAESKYGHNYEGKTSGSFNNLKADIFDLVYNQRIPIMIRVPNHTVVAVGFQGTLTVDVDGEPYVSEITPEMILVNDPGNSGNTTLQDTINQRGNVEYYNYYTE